VPVSKDHVGNIKVEALDDLILEVVETRTFQNDADDKLSDQEREDLALYLAKNPEVGVVIPGAGGIRKVRWAGSGRGKRGGYRVIYYYLSPHVPLFLLALYAKAERIDLTADDRRLLGRLVEDLVREYSGSDGAD